MGNAGHGWRWWQKGTVGGVLLLFILVAVMISIRRPWVEPLPGVRVEMTRPFVREAALGPDSAYRLLLMAIASPPTVANPSGPRIWRNDWSDAQTKFKIHPWPAELPPATVEDLLVPSSAPFDTWDDMVAVQAKKARGPGPDPESPWTRAQCAEIGQLVKLYEPQIALLDQALAAPNPQMPTADSPSFRLPYLAPTRQLARWLAVSAYYRAAHGDYAGSCRDLERILGMANLVSRGGVLINHLVTIACDAIAVDTARTIAIRHPLPVPVLREMAQAFLAADDEAEPFVEAMRAEALPVINTVPDAYRGGLISLGYSHSPSKGERLAERCVLALAPLAGSTPRATTANIRACYQHFVAVAEKPYATVMKEGGYGVFTNALFAPRRGPFTLIFRTRDPLGFMLASMLLPALDRANEKAALRDAMLRGMALFFAIQAYERERGALPETLDQLVPDYLPRVPLDPFDDTPFRYRRSGVPGLPPEAWAVYSIGGDLVDDGGTAHSVGTPTDKVGPNPDIVWPSQDYPPAIGW